MSTLWVAEVQIHLKPMRRVTFIVHAETREEVLEQFIALPGSWHELIACKPLNTNTIELTQEVVEYGGVGESFWGKPERPMQVSRH